MTRATLLVVLCALLGLPLAACEQTAAAKVPVEKLPELTPSLPSVPTIPPAPYPTQFGDQSYSVYGLRRQLRRTINTDVNVTGFIQNIFVPPVCEKGEKCPLPPAPHFWLADSMTEADKNKMLLVAGYDENQLAIDEAIKDAARGKGPSAEEVESGLLPIPVDFAVGNKAKMKGRFAYISGSGFQSSEGVLGYAGHETLQAVAPVEEKKK